MEIKIFCEKCGEKTPHTFFKPSGDDDTIFFVCGKCFNNEKYLHSLEIRDTQYLKKAKNKPLKYKTS